MIATVIVIVELGRFCSFTVFRLRGIERIAFVGV